MMYLKVLTFTYSSVCGCTSSKIGRSKRECRLRIHDFSRVPGDLLRGVGGVKVSDTLMLGRCRKECLGFVFGMSALSFGLIKGGINFSRDGVRCFESAHEHFSRGCSALDDLCVFSTTREMRDNNCSTTVASKSVFMVPVRGIIGELGGGR